jgi:hypothetical protein
MGTLISYYATFDPIAISPATVPHFYAEAVGTKKLLPEIILQPYIQLVARKALYR